MDSRCHILVVDDQKGVRQLLETFFQEKGFKVTTATNGQEAVSSADRETPDLIVMDVKMPVMSGAEALARIKAKFPRLPVIMMTAYADLLMQQELARLGAEKCLLKPLELEQLYQIVDNVLKQDLDKIWSGIVC